tara:strand:- start:219 stop:341 length:123 start_codon:yes stop_codon:yes gene_type:complete
MAMQNMQHSTQVVVEVVVPVTHQPVEVRLGSLVLVDLVLS